MNSIFKDATNETINLIYKETQKNKNKRKIEDIIIFLTKTALKPIFPYLLLIVALIIILFLMNCFQFFYYVKYIIQAKDNKAILSTNF